MDKNAGQFLQVMPIKRLKLSLLVTDAGTQTRNEIYPSTVEEYSDDIKAGVKFPALVVFYDKKNDAYYLVDGFHRHLAFEWNGIKEYNCDVIDGDLKAAIKFALGANTKHGLRRTNADKRKAVEIALENFTTESDRKVAEMCAVSHVFVSTVRPKITGQVLTVNTSNSENPNKTANSACPPRRTGRDGKSYPAAKPASAAPAEKQAKGPKDDTGLPIPPEIREAWEKATNDGFEITKTASFLRSEIRKAQESKNPAFYETDFTDNIAKLDMVVTDLKRSVPYAVCFKCNGVNFKNCPDCKHRGWISKFFYDTCVPMETKKITKR